MDAAALQATLDAVVVGHLDGHGRTVLWRTPGARDVTAAIRQAAVLPGRLDAEPGWLLRRLPDGRALFLAGGANHPDLRDGLGRSGIFHGAGFVAPLSAMAVALGTQDATRLCIEVVRTAMRGMGVAPSLTAACREAKTAAPTWSTETQDLPARDWPSARASLLAHGLRPCAGPLGGRLVTGQPELPAGPLPPLRLDVGEPAARRVLAAWS